MARRGFEGYRANQLTGWLYNRPLTAVADMHNLPDALTAALEEARAHTGQPTVVICETTKGKGVSFMENNPDFHGKAPDKEQTEQAYRELAD